MKYFRAIAYATFGFIMLVCSASAQAAPTLSLSVDGGAETFICADGCPVDLSGTAGVVQVALPALGIFESFAGIGVTKPTLPGNPASPFMDMSASVLANDAGRHTLRLMFSDTGFTDLGAIFGELHGSLSAGSGSSITARAYYSISDALFDISGPEFVAAGTFLGTSAFAGTTASGLTPSKVPFSVTQVVDVEFDGFGGLNLDFVLIRSVPEPTSLVLVSLALAGMGLAKRKALNNFWFKVRGRHAPGSGSSAQSNRKLDGQRSPAGQT